MMSSKLAGPLPLTSCRSTAECVCVSVKCGLEYWWTAEPAPGMKVLVTGATGFMGGRLCAALATAGGHGVRAFVLRGLDASGLPPAVEVAYGDVTDMESLIAVFHTAAAVEPWRADPSVFHTVNVGGLKNVLKAAQRTPTVKKIVYTSSYLAIGPTDGYVADETQMHRGKAFCTEYEKSKFLADRIALQAAAEGVPITLVYPGVMYGAGELTTGNFVPHLLIERFNGRLPCHIGDGNDMQSFSHVDDVVSGHIAAMEKGRVGERYLLAHRRKRAAPADVQPDCQYYQHKPTQIPLTSLVA